MARRRSRERRRSRARRRSSEASVAGEASVAARASAGECSAAGPGRGGRGHDDGGAALGRRRRRAARSAGARIQHVRAVLGDQRLRLDAVLVRPRATPTCSRRQPVLVPGDLRTVRGVHHPVQLGQTPSRRWARTALSAAAAARARRLRPLVRCCVASARRALRRRTPPRPPRRRRRGRPRPARRAADGGRRPAPGRPLGRGRRRQRVGPPADGAQPLLHGAHLEARLHLGRRGPPPARRASSARSSSACGVLDTPGRGRRILRRPPASASSTFSCGELGLVLLGAALAPRRPRRRAAWPRRRRRARRPASRPSRPEISGRGRVRGAASGQRISSSSLAALVGRLGRLGERSPPPPRSASSAAASRAAASSAAARTSSSDCAAGRTAVRPVRADQVAVGGHGSESQDCPERTPAASRQARRTPRRRASSSLTAPASSAGPVTRSTAHRARRQQDDETSGCQWGPRGRLPGHGCPVLWPGGTATSGGPVATGPTPGWPSGWGEAMTRPTVPAVGGADGRSGLPRPRRGRSR